MNTNNSNEFLSHFNLIEEHLRKKYGPDSKRSFSSLMYEAFRKDRLTAKYQDDLKQFKSLRNVIVHQYRNNVVIAEPHDETVRAIKELWLRLDRPIGIDRPEFIHQVFSIEHYQTIGLVLPEMAKNFYSQVPVYKDGVLIDFLSNNTIALWLANNVVNELVDIKDTTIDDILDYRESNSNYKIVGRKSLLHEVLDMFMEFANQGKYLEAVLITHNGKKTEKPLGIVTMEDIPKINMILKL